MHFFSFGSRLPWWVKIHTKVPYCTYYFGPFENVREARNHQPGYVEDLVLEGAQGIDTRVQRCDPEVFTIENKG